MNTLPPEVVGCLKLAERHLKQFRSPPFPQFYWRVFRIKQRREERLHKVQKLVSRAVKLLAARGLTVEDILPWLEQTTNGTTIGTH